jgi:hypothetical protein
LRRAFDRRAFFTLRSSALPWACAAFLLAACGDDESGGHHHDGGHAGHDGHGDHDAGARCPDGIPDFVTGLTAASQSGALRARLVRATPTPPRKKAPNDWTVQFIGEDGEPRTDVSVADACAFMAVHGHGESTQMIEAGDEPGEVELGDLYFSMRGPWEVQLAVSTSDADADAGAGSGSAEVFTDCDRYEERPGQEMVVFDICVMDE